MFPVLSKVLLRWCENPFSQQNLPTAASRREYEVRQRFSLPRLRLAAANSRRQGTLHAHAFGESMPPSIDRSETGLPSSRQPYRATVGSYLLANQEIRFSITLVLAKSQENVLPNGSRSACPSSIA